jgi:hypothetical protein
MEDNKKLAYLVDIKTIAVGKTLIILITKQYLQYCTSISQDCVW